MCGGDLFIDIGFSKTPLGPEFWSILHVILAIIYPGNRNKGVNTYFSYYSVTSM